MEREEAKGKEDIGLMLKEKAKTMKGRLAEQH